MDKALKVIDGRISTLFPLGKSKKDKSISYIHFGLIQPIYDETGTQIDSQAINCVAFGSLAEKIARMPILSKKHLDAEGNFRSAWIGTRVLVTGRMISSTYEDKDGKQQESENLRVVGFALPIQSFNDDLLTNVIDNLRAEREKRII